GAAQPVNSPSQGTSTQPASVTFGAVSISPLTGNVHLDNPLDFRQSAPSPSLDDSPLNAVQLSLVYNSDTVNVQPIIQATLASDPHGSVPTQIQAQLTWNNGTPQSWVTFAATGHSAGDVYVLDTQVSGAVGSTGYYPWKVEVKATFSGGDIIDRTITGSAFVVANGSGDAFGQGWGLAGLGHRVQVGR